jgi:transketolase
MGPVFGNVLAAAAELPREGLELWVCGELPFSELPGALVDRLKTAERVICVEEHYAHGGFGSAFALAALRQGVAPKHFVHLHAAGYPSGTYGGQAFHQRESHLDKMSLVKCLKGEA